MLYKVSLINSAEVIGATFPGKDNAQINLIPNFLAAILSIPPGLDAKSIMRTSSFTFCNSASFKIVTGMVLIIISNFPR